MLYFGHWIMPNNVQMNGLTWTRVSGEGQRSMSFTDSPSAHVLVLLNAVEADIIDPH